MGSKYWIAQANTRSIGEWTKNQSLRRGQPRGSRSVTEEREIMALLNGKAGLVTGADGGIGRATAIAYAREGAKVVIGDVEQARKGAEETVAIIKRSGGE